jgi:hypothetical protein
MDPVGRELDIHTVYENRCKTREKLHTQKRLPLSLAGLNAGVSREEPG